MLFVLGGSRTINRRNLMGLSKMTSTNEDAGNFADRLPMPRWSAGRHFVAFVVGAGVLGIMSTFLFNAFEPSFGLTAVPVAQSIGQYGFYVAPLTQALFGIVSFWVGTSISKRYLREPNMLVSGLAGAVYSLVFYFMVIYVLNSDHSSTEARIVFIAVGLLFPGAMMIAVCIASSALGRLTTRR